MTSAEGRGSVDGALRVVHVNDVAGVASAAIAQARLDGLPWRLWPLPAVRGAAMPVKVWRRSVDLARFTAAARTADVLHVHFGHFAYYAWAARRPYLLHLHGTDVRANLHRRGLGELTSAAIRRAGAVVYSTPDLAEAVTALRPDAVWLPAPIAPGLGDAAAGAAGTATAGDHPAVPRVVFASRWDAVKGLEEQIALAQEIHRWRPDVELVGVDWGTGTEDARSAGVRLVAKLPAERFRALLESADVVIGQLASGALGVTDLEAMAIGRPLVARFTQRAAYGSEPQLWNTEDASALACVEEILGASTSWGSRLAAARAWTLDHHGAQRFVHALLPLYTSIA